MWRSKKEPIINFINAREAAGKHREKTNNKEGLEFINKEGYSLDEKINPLDEHKVGLMDKPIEYKAPRFFDFMTIWSYFLCMLYLVIVTFFYEIKNNGKFFDGFMIRFHYTNYAVQLFICIFAVGVMRPS